MPPDPTATAPSDRKVGFSVETIDIRLIRIFMAVVEAGGGVPPNREAIPCVENLVTT